MNKREAELEVKALTAELRAEGEKFRMEVKKGRDLKAAIKEGELITLNLGQDDKLLGYSPYFTDYRMRVYSAGGAVNLQGNDLDKALMSLPAPIALTDEGREAIWCELARYHEKRFEKTTYAEAIAFAKGNIDLYCDIAFNGAKREGIKKPIQLIAMIRDAFNPDGSMKDTCSRTVAVDATSSGSQILGAATMCAGTLRLTGFGSEARQGVVLYGQVGVYVQQKLNQDFEYDKRSKFQEDSDVETVLYKLVKSGLLTLPATFKRAVMTYLYSAGPRSMARYIMEALKDEGLKVGMSIGMELSKLAKEAMAVLAPGAVQMFEWLKTIGGALAEGAVETFAVHGKVPFVTGFIKGSDEGLFGEHLSVHTSNPRKFQTTLAPNAVHNIDARILMAAFNKCQAEGIQVALIHDSFGVHPNYRRRMQVILIESLQQVLSERPFEAIYDKVCALGLTTAEGEPVDIPSPPFIGDFKEENTMVNSILAFD